MIFLTIVALLALLFIIIQYHWDWFEWKTSDVLYNKEESNRAKIYEYYLKIVKAIESADKNKHYEVTLNMARNFTNCQPSVYSANSDLWFNLRDQINRLFYKKMNTFVWLVGH